MQVLSPLSQSQEEEIEDDEGQEFVDAPDSQMEEPPPRHRDSLLSHNSEGSHNSRDISPAAERPKPRRKSSGISSSSDPKWRKRIESSLIKLTAEVAALREQLESRRLFVHTLKFRIFRSFSRLVWGVVKHLAMDAFLLGILILYLRKKEDRRFEGAVRVLLGDAVAQVQSVGVVKQLGKIQLPTLGKKRPN